MNQNFFGKLLSIFNISHIATSTWKVQPSACNTDASAHSPSRSTRCKCVANESLGHCDIDNANAEKAMSPKTLSAPCLSIHLAAVCLKYAISAGSPCLIFILNLLKACEAVNWAQPASALSCILMAKACNPQLPSVTVSISCKLLAASWSVRAWGGRMDDPGPAHRVLPI